MKVTNNTTSALVLIAHRLGDNTTLEIEKNVVRQYMIVCLFGDLARPSAYVPKQ